MSDANVGNIQYTVTADVQGFVDTMKTVPEELGKTSDAMDKTDKSAAKLDTGLGNLKKTFAALGVAAALKAAVSITEEYDRMAEQVRMTSGSTAEFIMVQERLQATANGTYRALSEAQKVYVETADALRGLGYGTKEVLDITDSLSYSIVRNAASTEKAAGAINAYSKAIQKGRVDADAWATIMAAVPTVAQDIGDATGKTAEEVRKLGSAGKLAADQLNQGLLASLDKNKTAADEMATTTTDAFTQLRNNIGATLSSMNEQAGATQTMVKAIQMAAEVVKDFGADNERMASFISLAGTAAAATATVIAGRLVGSLGAYALVQGKSVLETWNSVAASKAAAAAALQKAQSSLAAAKGSEAELAMLIALNPALAESSGLNAALAAAQTRVATASAAVTTALTGVAGAASYAGIAMKGLNTVMTFLGGPLGVIMIAAAAMYYFANAASATKVDVDALNGSLQKLSFSQLGKAYNDAGDDIVKLNSKLSASMSELRTMTKRVWESDDDFAKRKTEQQAQYDGIKQEIKARQDLRDSISQQQDALAAAQDEQNKGGAKTPEHKTSDADQRVLDNLEKQKQLAMLAGEARARLAAEQHLSADATDEEKKAAGDLAVEIYRLTQAKKDAAKADKVNANEKKKDDTEAKKHAEQNTKAIEDYAVSIGLAAMKGEDLARAQAISKLNKFATKEDVATMDALAKAMYQVQLAAENKAKLAEVSPGASESQRYAEEMKKIEELRAADLISNQQYMDLKANAETSHDEQLRAIQEQAFIRQSEANKFLMSSIDALGRTSTSVFAGILSGTMNGQQAMQAFAQTIFQESIGALVQMGVQAIKTALIQKSAAAAAAIAYVGGVSAQVATTTALAGQAAYASTAAIPVVGPAAAPGAAAAAMSAAGALGAPAVSAAAGVAGGRLYGGPVAAGSMYKVNEDGSPELFQANNGDQFMMPGTNGQVISNKNATGGSGMIVNININVDAGGGSTTETSGQTGATQLAGEFESGVLTIMQRETQQGGILWNMQNDRY